MKNFKKERNMLISDVNRNQVTFKNSVEIYKSKLSRNRFRIESLFF